MDSAKSGYKVLTESEIKNVMTCARSLGFAVEAEAIRGNVTEMYMELKGSKFKVRISYAVHGSKPIVGLEIKCADFHT